VPATADELPVPADADVVPAAPPPPLDEQPARNATAVTIADTETALFTNPAMMRLLCIKILLWTERSALTRSAARAANAIDPHGRRDHRRAG